MKELNEKTKNLLFIVPNGFLAILLMVYYFINNEPGFPYSIIPAYFFGVVAAGFIMFVVHPKVKAGKLDRRAFRTFNFAVLFMTIVIIILLIMRKII